MELPLLQPIYEKYRDRGFEIVAIDVRADNANAQKFIAENKLTYPLLIGNVPMAVKEWQIQYTPSSFFVGPDGKVLSFGGEYTKETIGALDTKIAEMLKE